MSKFKFIFKRSILPCLAVRPLQPVYQLIHRISLIGMNIGPVGEIDTSGEKSLARKMVRLLPADAKIFDVGANFGEFSLLCFRLGAKHITAFEPVPSIFLQLQKRISEEQASGAITAVAKGFSRESKRIEIRVTPGFEGNTSLRDREQDHLQAQSRVETIEVITLDQYCSERQVDHIHYMKIDIEGEELACLQGGKNLLEKGRVDYLHFEFGGCNIQSRVFFRDFWMLLSPNYRLFRILQHSLAPVFHYHEILEIFTTTNFLAIRNGLPIPR